MTRVQYNVFDSREEAIAAGWPDAEFGCWQRDPAAPKLSEGWIALELFTTEQQEHIALCANLASPRGPNARLNVDHEARKMWLEVVLPGSGDTWDENEVELQQEIEEYLGSGYTVTLTQPMQDMDGREWSEFEIEAK